MANKKVTYYDAIAEQATEQITFLSRELQTWIAVEIAAKAKAAALRGNESEATILFEEVQIHLTEILGAQAYAGLPDLRVTQPHSWKVLNELLFALAQATPMSTRSRGFHRTAN